MFPTLHFSPSLSADSDVARQFRPAQEANRAVTLSTCFPGVDSRVDRRGNTVACIAVDILCCQRVFVSGRWRGGLKEEAVHAAVKKTGGAPTYQRHRYHN